MTEAKRNRPFRIVTGGIGFAVVGPGGEHYGSSTERLSAARTCDLLNRGYAIGAAASGDLLAALKPLRERVICGGHGRDGATQTAIDNATAAIAKAEGK